MPTRAIGHQQLPRRVQQASLSMRHKDWNMLPDVLIKAPLRPRHTPRRAHQDTTKKRACRRAHQDATKRHASSCTHQGATKRGAPRRPHQVATKTETCSIGGLIPQPEVLPEMFIKVPPKDVLPGLLIKGSPKDVLTDVVIKEPPRDVLQGCS